MIRDQTVFEARFLRLLLLRLDFFFYLSGIFWAALSVGDVVFTTINGFNHITSIFLNWTLSEILLPCTLVAVRLKIAIIIEMRKSLTFVALFRTLELVMKWFKNVAKNFILIVQVLVSLSVEYLPKNRSMVLWFCDYGNAIPGGYQSTVAREHFLHPK